MEGKYTEKDLAHRGDTKEEYKRLRGIFDDLVQRGKSGIVLSIIEQEFVYHGIIFFSENPNNYPFIDDGRFIAHYLTYSFDLSGGSAYWTTRDRQVIKVPPLERDNHLNYLLAEADKWEVIIAPMKLHKEGFIKEAVIEARDDLKNLAKYHNITGRPYIKGSIMYRSLVAGINLRAKANYVFGTKYWQNSDPADLSFNFCGEVIEFTEYSMVHILNRHFAERTKQYPSGKDYHTEDVVPWAMPGQVKKIMTEIDATGLFVRDNVTKINLKYKGHVYQFWAQYQNRSIKGHKKPVPYKRIQSFYRATDTDLLASLKTNFSEVHISAELSVYVPI